MSFFSLFYSLDNCAIPNAYCAILTPEVMECVKLWAVHDVRVLVWDVECMKRCTREATFPLDHMKPWESSEPGGESIGDLDLRGLKFPELLKIKSQRL